MGRNYVYHLIDPRNNLPFYVGRGIKNRMYDHENEVKKERIPHRNKHLYYKIKQILNSGYTITYKKIHENINLERALALEIKEIEKQKKINPKLCNIGLGGEGGDNIMNNPNRDKILIKFRILCKNMVEKYVKGKPKSDDTKRKLSLILRTPEWNEKNSKNRKGKALGPRSYMSDPIRREIWIKKISENHADVNGEKNPFKGKKHTDETRNKMSKKRRKMFKVSFDNQEAMIEGGKILRNFVSEYNKNRGTNYNVPMLKYKNNSAGWKIKLYE